MNTNPTEEPTKEAKTLNKVIRINEAKIQSHLDTMVSDTTSSVSFDFAFSFAEASVNPKLWRTSGRGSIAKVEVDGRIAWC